MFTYCFFFFWILFISENWFNYYVTKRSLEPIWQQQTDNRRVANRGHYRNLIHAKNKNAKRLPQFSCQFCRQLQTLHSPFSSIFFFSGGPFTSCSGDCSSSGEHVQSFCTSDVWKNLFFYVFWLGFYLCLMFYLEIFLDLWKSTFLWLPVCENLVFLGFFGDWNSNFILGVSVLENRSHGKFDLCSILYLVGGVKNLTFFPFWSACQVITFPFPGDFEA